MGTQVSLLHKSGWNVHCTPKDQKGEASPIPEEPAHCWCQGSCRQQEHCCYRHLPASPPEGPVPQEPVRLVRELEKKFSGQHVVLVAQRKIQDKESRKTRKASKGQVRPMSRTLTAVHEAILGDLVYPANISGKRIRMSLDGNKLIKVSLDNPYEVSDKLETFSAVYAALTGKHATFELPAQEE